MLIVPWLLPSILAVILWGVSMFLPKLAIRRLPPSDMTIYSYSFFLLWSIILQGFYGFHIDWNLRSSLLAMMVGVIGGIAQVLYNISLSASSMTYSVVVTSLYPVPATLLAFSILGEDLTARQIAGLVLGTASLILMVKASDKQTEG